MTSICKTSVIKTMLGLLLVAALISSLPALVAQAQEAQKYTMEEYKAYQEITAENNAAQKAGLIVKFLQQYPQSGLREHITAVYQNMINDLQKGQRWSELLAAGEQYLRVAPDDVFTIAMLATGYQQTKNYKAFVAFGEKTYAKKPSGNLAYYLTKAYMELQNDAKFLEWGEKAADALPDNYDITLELAKAYARGGRNAQAAKYARQCIKALQGAKKPEPTSDAAWRDYTNSAFANCYGIIGNVAYEQKDYTTAVANLENSVRYFPKNDMAYYYLGLSYWQQKRVDIAMLNLAKAYLLRGKASAPAKQHLDNLYRSTHQNSLAGEDRVIAKAEDQLRMALPK